MSSVTIQNLHVNSDKEETKVYLLTGEHEEQHPEAPKGLGIEGVITTPADWWKIHEGNIDHQNARVEYSYSSAWIKLYVNQHLSSIKSVFKGSLDLSDISLEFDINKKVWGLQKLSKFIRFNKRYFKDKEAAESLRLKLSTFSAKVSKVFEESRDDKGSRRALFEKVVEHELPEFITIQVPLFKGSNSLSSFECYLEVNESDSGYTIKLLSPDLSELMEKETEKEMAPVLEVFKGKIPVIRIN